MPTVHNWEQWDKNFREGVALPGGNDKMLMDLTLTGPGLFGLRDLVNYALENDVKMNKIDDNFDKLSTNILDVKKELSVIIMKNTESTENVSNMINTITTKVNKIDDTMTTVFSTQWNLIDTEKENEIET